MNFGAYMKRVLLVALILGLSGCSRSTTGPSQTSPEPAVQGVPPAPGDPPKLTIVWVVVIEKNGSGECVQGAAVEIVRGQVPGRSIAQRTPCSFWDPDYDAQFKNVNAGEELMLRASAPGYAPTELTVVPTLGPQTAVTFELSRLR
jgi:hypothetical protein